MLDPISEHVSRLHSLAQRVADALETEGVTYRIVGGFAVFIQVEQVEWIAARLTPDVDVMVNRADLEYIERAAERHGFEYRPESSTNARGRGASSTVHLVYAREKFREDYLEPMPDFSEPVRTSTGICLAPVSDLVRMKLTSYRIIDRVHIQDLDSAELVTPEIEATLSAPLAARLAEIRATEYPRLPQ